MANASSSQALTSLPPDSLFQHLETYPWSSDIEFQSGLRAILGSNTLSHEQTEHLTLRARCFYFSRKNNISIDFDAYQEWRTQHTSSSQPISDTSTYTSSTPDQYNGNSFQGNDASKPRTSKEPVAAEARYPTSFGQIVELINSGQPVPGIKDIPDTLLSGQDSQAATAKRKKPWEQEGKDESKVISILSNSQ